MKKEMQPPTRGTMIFSLLYSMIPLLGFWLIEKYYSLEAGVIAAIALALAEVAWVYAKEKRFEPFASWSAALIILMGIISWQLQSDLFLKLKPAIFEMIFALLFLVSSCLGKPFMMVMAQKQFGEIGLNSFQAQYLKGVNWRIGFFFLAHVFLIVYASLYFSNDQWLFISGPFFYILLGIYFALEFFYSRFSLRRHIESWQKQQAFLEYQRSIIQKVKAGDNKPQGMKEKRIP
ncbi:MAG: septation protein IspZ [Candidatus Brocadiae bacterium]|nr:septation protein IspZ [Candidatus Brocadiia bacterium]